MVVLYYLRFVRKLIDCVDVQAGLCLCCWPTPEDRLFSLRGPVYPINGILSKIISTIQTQYYISLDINLALLRENQSAGFLTKYGTSQRARQ